MRSCTRRAPSSACGTEAETGVPAWGGQGRGVRGKRKKRLRAPGRGRERRDLESGLGSEFREAQSDTFLLERKENGGPGRRSILQVSQEALPGWD